ncbi:MAG TPA: hypothetical protein VLG76_05300 [Rhabdochlamydiaceae bacterium]|nr:hypothetical protein [Rhabdochlamydiaceae bacterium]
MKKSSWYVLTLSLILVIVIFFEIKDTITDKKDFFISRWFSSLLYSDFEYSKKIEVKPYLLNDDQVIEMLTHPEQEVQQPPQKDLYLKNVNLVLRIKNDGGSAVWGVLAYRVFENGNWFRVEVNVPSSKREINKQVYDYVIPLGVVVPFNNNNLPEHIQYKWCSLYSKH